MTKPIDYQGLTAVAYCYAEDHYSQKNARFDVIVECMTQEEIADELRDARIRRSSGAIKWAKARAGLAHEMELNQAEDGPESCIGSSKYDGRHERHDCSVERISNYTNEGEWIGA